MSPPEEGVIDAAEDAPVYGLGSAKTVLGNAGGGCGVVEGNGPGGVPGGGPGGLLASA